jgi:hypothetical protein
MQGVLLNHLKAFFGAIKLLVEHLPARTHTQKMVAYRLWGLFQELRVRWNKRKVALLGTVKKTNWLGGRLFFSYTQL